MAGEAWQWLQDWCHDTYSEAPKDGSAWQSPAGTERVIRGGAWDYGAASQRSASRACRAPGKRADDAGIRLAQSIVQ
jgi:formylglycine-generating enzyme required for sulfatase activity